MLLYVLKTRKKDKAPRQRQWRTDIPEAIYNCIAMQAYKVPQWIFQSDQRLYLELQLFARSMVDFVECECITNG